MAVSDLDDATRVRNEAEHTEECEASESRFFHSPASATTSPPVEFDCYSFPGPSYLGADALPPDNFGADELARVTVKPLISATECASMIADAEAHASWHTAGRSAHYASRAGASVSILDLPDALALVNERLLPALLPALGDAFPTGMLNADIRLQEARLVKYNATAGQTELGMHRDGPVVTATVALNAPQEYEGGGTLIEALHSKPQASRRTARPTPRRLFASSGDARCCTRGASGTAAPSSPRASATFSSASSSTPPWSTTTGAACSAPTPR